MSEDGSDLPSRNPKLQGSVMVFVVGEGKDEKNRPKRKERGEKKGIFLLFIIVLHQIS